MSGPTARARLDGSVHGVVVHTQTCRVIALQLEGDRNAGCQAVRVGVVLADLEVGQRGLALPAVGQDPELLVEQALSHSCFRAHMTLSM